MTSPAAICAAEGVTVVQGSIRSLSEKVRPVRDEGRAMLQLVHRRVAPGAQRRLCVGLQR